MTDKITDAIIDEARVHAARRQAGQQCPRCKSYEITRNQLGPSSYELYCEDCGKFFRSETLAAVTAAEIELGKRLKQTKEQACYAHDSEVRYWKSEIQRQTKELRAIRVLRDNLSS